MLSSIELKNFQGHSNSKLEFDPGVNIIVGPSDNGKSSIIRAIEWIRSNRPRGTNFIKEDQSESKVILTTNNIQIERWRNLNSTGYYEVNDEKFEMMGSEVPNTVTEFLNLSDINIQSQLDTHFLILDSAGKVSDFLNSITKLDKLTKAAEKLKSRRREIQKEIDNLLIEKQRTEAFLDSGVIEKVKSLNKIYRELTILNDERNALVQKITRAAHILQELQEIERKRIPEKIVIQYEEIVNKIGELVEERKELNTNIYKVHSLVTSINNTNDNYEDTLRMINKYEKDIVSIETQLKSCPYCGQDLTEKARRILLK